MRPALEEIARDAHCQARLIFDEDSPSGVSLEAELMSTNGIERAVARIYSIGTVGDPVTILPSLRVICQRNNIPYLVVCQGQSARLYLANSTSSEFLDHIPRLSGSLNAAKVTLEQLRPMESIITVRNLASRLADEVFAKHGHDRLRLFDILLALLTTKVYDEQENPRNLQLVPGRGRETFSETFQRLFRMALAKFEMGDWARVDLDTSALQSCAEILTPYSLTETIRLGASSEVLGTFYQEIVTSTFRGSLGAYFTPKPMCELGVALCRIEDPIESILDISCGTGTYLTTAFERIKPLTAKPPIVVGVDIQQRMVLATILNLIFNGVADRVGIHSDGLKVSLAELHKTHSEIPAEGFDLAVGNPPFAGFEVGSELLIDKGSKQRGAGVRVHKVIPFIIKIVQLLRPGGLSSLVVPASVLNAEAEQFVRLRKLLLRETWIEAIVTFPRDALVHTGTGIESALLVFRRKKNHSRPPEDVFITAANNLGYDRKGHPAPGSEVASISATFRKRDFAQDGWIRYEVFTNSERWDPLWLSTSSQFSTLASEKLVRLTEIASVAERKLSKHDLPASFSYFEVGDCDPQTGKVAPHNGDRSLFVKKGRLRHTVKKGDVLLPNHRDSLLAKTYSETGRSAVVVTDNLDGCVTTDRFIVLVPKVEPILLRAILNSKLVRDQLVRHARGSASSDVRDKVLNQIWVPKAWLEESFARRVERLVDLSNDHENSLAATRRQLQDMFVTRH